MAVSVAQTPTAIVLSLPSSWSIAEVQAAVLDRGPRPAIVFDLSQSTLAGVESLLVAWDAAFVAFIVHDDRMAEAVERYGRQASAKVRACESVPEALGWIEHLQQARPKEASAPAVASVPPAPPGAGPETLSWPTRPCSVDLLASAVALLRALQTAQPEGDPIAHVRSAGGVAHREAWERHVGALPPDVGNVLALTTGFWCDFGQLELDFVSGRPEWLEFGSARLLVVDRCGVEGVTLELGPESSRVWWIEHDGHALALLARGADHWVVRCAAEALRQHEQNQLHRDTLAMGLPLGPTARPSAMRSDLRLDSRPVTEVGRTVASASPAHAWLATLPSHARVYDFRQAAPGTEIAGLWSDGEWSHHGEFWAVV